MDVKALGDSVLEAGPFVVPSGDDCFIVEVEGVGDGGRIVHVLHGQAEGVGVCLVGEDDIDAVILVRLAFGDGDLGFGNLCLAVAHRIGEGDGLLVGDEEIVVCLLGGVSIDDGRIGRAGPWRQDWGGGAGMGAVQDDIKSSSSWIISPTLVCYSHGEVSQRPRRQGVGGIEDVDRPRLIADEVELHDQDVDVEVSTVGTDGA